MSIRIAVYTHCQMNENPCPNQVIHMLFEHGSELENTLNEPCIICMTLYMESIADHTDHFFTDVFLRKNFAYGCSVRNKPENSTCLAGNLKANSTCPP